jgi:hypothetical protein
MYLLFKLVRFFAILFRFVVTTAVLVSQRQSTDIYERGREGERERGREEEKKRGREGEREKEGRERKRGRERERNRCSYYLCTGKSKSVN